MSTIEFQELNSTEISTVSAGFFWLIPAAAEVATSVVGGAIATGEAVTAAGVVGEGIATARGAAFVYNAPFRFGWGLAGAQFATGGLNEGASGLGTLVTSRLPWWHGFGFHFW